MENFYREQSRHMPDFKILTNLPNVELNTQEAVLSLIVVLGSSVSLVGLIFAFITYSLFSDQRSLSGTLIMNLLATLFMTQLMYVIGVGGTEDPELCVSLAFALQYFHLAEFCWIFSLTADMYRTFATNFHSVNARSSRITSSFVKYSVFGWATPVLFLLFGFFLHRQFRTSYSPETFRFDYLNCWFLNEKIYVYSFVMPITVSLVLIADKLYKSWIAVRYSIALQVDDKFKERMRLTRYGQYNLYARITLILTVTHINGVVARLTRNNFTWITFNVLHSLQGLLVAVAVTCNYQTFRVYAKSMRKRKREAGEMLIETSCRQKRTDDVSRSASLDTLSWQLPMLSV